MSDLEIRYHEHKEKQRSNLANEAETHRSNVAKEQETNRHNVATELETSLHNRTTESQGWASIAETERHNKRSEDIQMTSVQENIRHNAQMENLSRRELEEIKLKESQAHIAKTSAEINKLQSDKRKNLQQAALYKEQIDTEKSKQYQNISAGIASNYGVVSDLFGIGTKAASAQFGSIASAAKLIMPLLG